MCKETKQLKKYLKNNNGDFVVLVGQKPWCDSIDELVFCVKHDVDEMPLCEYKDCTNKKSYSIYNRNGYSDGCRNHAKKVSFIKKYGVENPFQSDVVKEKIKETTLKNYGVEHISKSEYIKLKKKETSIKNYGVSHPLKTEIIKSKSKLSKLKKYGDANFNNKHKAKKTLIEKYGVDSTRKLKNKEFWLNLDYDTLEKELQEFSVTYIANKYGIHFTTIYDIARKKGFKISSYYENEQIIIDYISGVVEYKRNDRKLLKGKELDIYIPKIKLAIEVNGNYWHSNKHCKDLMYHVDKTEKCEKHGISLIHIFEDEIKNNRDQIELLINRFIDASYYDEISLKDIENVETFVSLTSYMFNYGGKFKEIIHNGEFIGLVNFEIIDNKMIIYNCVEVGKK